MRWIGFAVVGVVVVTLQVSLAPWLEIGHVRPDLCLVFVVFLGLRVSASDAGMGAFLIGMSGDLMSLERLGLVAISYMLVALLVSGVKEFLFKQRIVTFVAVTLVVGVILQVTWLVYRHFLYGMGQQFSKALMCDVVGGAVYSAVLAALIFGILMRISPVFSQEPRRYAQASRNRLV